MKQTKKVIIPRSFARSCINGIAYAIGIGLIYLLLSRPVAVHLTYIQNVCLIVLVAFSVCVVEALWVHKKHRGLFTSEEYRRYLIKQTGIFAMITGLIILITWFIKMTYQTW